MDKNKIQSALESRTVRYAVGGIIAMIIKWAGLPMLPDDVSNEALLIAMGVLDAIITAGLAGTAWFRIKARKIIDRVF